MDSVSILSKLAVINGVLTKKEQKIAEYIKENIINIRTIKIAELSKVTGIGYSPIYSFIEKLGFNGYRNFIIAVVAEQERLYTNNLNLEPTQNIFWYYQDIIQRNNQILVKNKIIETVQILRKAKIVYLAGVGNSGVAVQELANKLAIFGFLCSILNCDETNIILRGSLIQEEELLICLSISGETNGIINVAKEAKSNGANVVVVTSQANSNLTKYADFFHLIISSELYERNNIYISPLLAFIYWTDNLIQALLTIDIENKYLDNKNRINKIIKKYR